jgi:hypothetical protein
MEKEILQLKDIAVYLPYGLCYYPQDAGYARYSDSVNFDNDIIGINELGEGGYDVEDIKPVLRPLSDLYKTIVHKNKEIIPIVYNRPPVT